MPVPLPCAAHVPEDWTAMRQAIWEWVRAEVDPGVEVVWAKQPVPAPPKPYVYIQVILPPARVGQDDIQNAEGCAFRFTLSPINPTPFVYTFTMKELDGTVIVSKPKIFATAVTSDLAALSCAGAINGSEYPGFSAKVLTVDPASVYVTRDNGQPFTMEVTEPDVALKLVEQLVGARTATFSLDVIAPKPALDAVDPAADADLALRIAAQLVNSLEAPDVDERLKVAGWGVIGVEGTRKPDQVAGSIWEDRAGFDVRLACRSRRMRLVDWIESAVIEADGSGIVLIGTVGS